MKFIFTKFLIITFPVIGFSQSDTNLTNPKPKNNISGNNEDVISEKDKNLKNWSLKEKDHFYQIADSMSNAGFTQWGQVPSYRNNNIIFVQKKYTYKRAIFLIRQNDKRLLSLFTKITW